MIHETLYLLLKLLFHCQSMLCMKHFLLVIIVTTFCHGISAQEISTDRPDQTESAMTIPKQSFQLETGTSVEIAGNINQWAISSSLFRFGLLKGVEVRLAAETGRFSNIKKVKSWWYIADLEAGLKVNLVNNDKFQLGCLAHAVLPTGSKETTTGKLGLVALVSVSHSLWKNTEAGYNIGYELTHNQKGEPQQNLLFSTAIGMAISQKLGFFIEAYGSLDNLDELVLHYDNGFTYLLLPNFQLDFSFGTGISKTTNFFGIGLSWLISD